MNATTENKKGRDSCKSATPTTNPNGTGSALPESRGIRVIAADYDGMCVSFTADGWFNATAAAKRFSKRISHWLENVKTQQYMAALAEALNIRNSGYFVRAHHGRYGGTWLHPKLAVAFARWCDARFAVWCDLQIDRILRGGHSSAQLPPRAAKRSNVTEREPLYVLAGQCVARHRLRFPTVYRSMSSYAGCESFRKMTCSQVCDAASFASRLLGSCVTTGDWRRIAENRIALSRTDSQLPLFSDAEFEGVV